MTDTTKTRVHAFGDDALSDLDSVGVAAAISAGDISAREAADAAIARAERVNPDLNAIVVTDYERGRALADGTHTGRLAGVPTFVKDNTDVAGLATLEGSLAVPNIPKDADAEFTTQLRSTGLVVLGKSTMPEFGWSASTEFATLPPTRNPWNTGYSSGASSGGAAALVASGVVPIAHANDGGGSIRIPAAACGLVGLKPTRGRVALAAESHQLPVDVISNGVVTRSVRDTAHFLAGAEDHRPAPGMAPVGLVEGPGQRRLRIGMVLDSLTKPTDDQTRAAVLDVAKTLEKLGHEVVPIEIPTDEKFVHAFTHYWAMLAFSMQKFGKKVVHPDFDPSLTDPLTQYLSKRFLRNIWRTPGAILTLKRSEKLYASEFDKNRIDVALSPTLAHTTPELGYLSPAGEFPQMFERLVNYASFTPLNNAAGSPAISLPLAQTTDQRPIGIHINGRHAGERTLLELAYELEAERPFARIQD